jgi:hypothetical protein
MTCNDCRWFVKGEKGKKWIDGKNVYFNWGECHHQPPKPMLNADAAKNWRYRFADAAKNWRYRFLDFIRPTVKSMDHICSHFMKFIPPKED